MESYTKYEKARILGARALQLAMNAPLLLNIPKDKLEEISFDPLKIAEIEFNSGILPITVKKPFPKKEEIEKEEGAEEIEIEEEIPEAPVAVEEKKEEKEERKKIVKEETATEEETDEEEKEEGTPIETEIE